MRSNECHSSYVFVVKHHFTAIFPGEPGLVTCPMILTARSSEFGTTFNDLE